MYTAAEITNIHVPKIVHPAQALECMCQSVVYLNLQDIYCCDVERQLKPCAEIPRKCWCSFSGCALLSTLFFDVSFSVHGSTVNDKSLYLYLYIYKHNKHAQLIIECTGQLTQGPVGFTPLSNMCLLTTWGDVTIVDITCMDRKDGGNSTKKIFMALLTGGT